MQSGSCDHVKDLVSRLVHLSLKVDAVAECMKRSSGRLPLVRIGVVLDQGPLLCQATVYVVGAVQRR